MKNTLNILFILLFVSSCSDTDSEDKHNTEKIIPLELEIEETFSIMQYSACSSTNMMSYLRYLMFMIQSHGKYQI